MFKVGDKVRIKDYDYFLKKYDLYFDGWTETNQIRYPLGWAKTMSSLCGKNGKIISIHANEIKIYIDSQIRNYNWLEDDIEIFRKYKLKRKSPFSEKKHGDET